MEAAYLKTYKSGKLKNRIKLAYSLMDECAICPRNCSVDRTSKTEAAFSGFCKTADKPVVSSYNPHFGEESVLSGSHGSGTIFMTNCNLRCRFCQNEDISLRGHGTEIEIKDLASMMIQLQDMGCHNINFVTPTHQTAMILDALTYAIEAGLNIPLVYNCGGYESVDTLKLLDGVFDIYMPDLKFSDSKVAQKACRAPDYFEIAKMAVTEMHRQVGDLIIDNNGLAQRGLLVRHLILPDNLAGSENIASFLSSLSKNTYINIMAQYHPCAEAVHIQGFNRRPSRDEIKKAITEFKKVGLTRFDKPDLDLSLLAHLLMENR